MRKQQKKQESTFDYSLKSAQVAVITKLNDISFDSLLWVQLTLVFLKLIDMVKFGWLWALIPVYVFFLILSLMVVHALVMRYVIRFEYFVKMKFIRPNFVKYWKNLKERQVMLETKMDIDSMKNKTVEDDG